MSRAFIFLALVIACSQNAKSSAGGARSSPSSLPYEKPKRRRATYSSFKQAEDHAFSAPCLSTNCHHSSTSFLTAYDIGSRRKSREGMMLQGNNPYHYLRVHHFASTQKNHRLLWQILMERCTGRECRGCEIRASALHQQQELGGMMDNSDLPGNIHRPLPFPCGVGVASMITKLKVENLVMVDSAEIELARGLIAITGETGAGKSLISSAFALATGARVRSHDLVGSKGSTARVQLDLELGEDHQRSTTEVLRRMGVPVAEDGRRLSVTRTLEKRGSSASVNGCGVKVGNLRELMSPLIYTVDADAFELFSRADSRLRTLDRALEPSEAVLAEEVRRVVGELREAEAVRLRLEQRCHAEGSPGGDGAVPVLQHWVEELDEFEEEQSTFMKQLRGQADAFVADWGKDMLGPLAEPFLAAEDGEASGSGMDQEGLSALWPRLWQIREGLLDIEDSRTKVELARQKVVDRYNPESVAHALTKVRDLLIEAEEAKVGSGQDILEQAHEDLNVVESHLRRIGDKLERSVQSLPVFPFTREEVDERFAKWKDLARKHGVSPERLGMMQQELRNELDEAISASEALPLAREKEASVRALAERLAGDLSSARRRAAAGLEQLVNPIMTDVGLEGAKIQVLMERSETLGLNGVDRIQYMMEANGGQTKGTVDAVASSGEKSRLLLLLETSLPGASPTDSPDRLVGSKEDDTGAVVIGKDTRPKGGAEGVDSAGRGIVSRTLPCTVLYDEIDAHVGGRTAVAVGRLLANQGRESQVVVVTHTASVAALADQQLLVEKNQMGQARATAGSPTLRPEPDGRTTNREREGNDADDIKGSGRQTASGCLDDSHESRGTRIAIREVQGRDRELEVARMAAGDMGGGAASELARAMLQCSRRRQGSEASADSDLR